MKRRQSNAVRHVLPVGKCFVNIDSKYLQLWRFGGKRGHHHEPDMLVQPFVVDAHV